MHRAVLAPLVVAGLALTACSSTAPSVTTSPSPTPQNGTAVTQSGTPTTQAGSPTTQAGTATGSPTPGEGQGALVVRGSLVSPSGASLGTVEIREADGGMRVVVRAAGLTPGFHAAHLHAIGTCEPNSADPSDPAARGNFNSAGGHLSPSGGDHPNHYGDLPPLLVRSNGQASLDVVTDRLTVQQLTDQDGTAFIVHERPDNYANIPTRYAPSGADAETKKAGDAGSRVACAVITRP